MEIHTKIPLKNFTTMKIGGPARFMVDVRTPNEVQSAVQNAKKAKLPFYVIGSGSNLIFTDKGFDGLIIRIRIPGFEVIGEDSSTVTIKLGAGENWDETVKKTVDMNLSGIEAMSGIPGTNGATPIQNVGAYGQEIADTLESLEAYDCELNKMVALAGSICEFSYRDSVFKSKFPGRFIITSITLKLYKAPPKPPFYDSLQQYFDEHKVKLFTSKIVRETVLTIRAEKLPDPKNKPNSGSFFKNVVVEKWQLDNILKIDSTVPYFEMTENLYKIPSGWLIDNCGLRGQLISGIRVYDKNALVLVNESATGYSDLKNAVDTVAGSVRDKFSVILEQEPVTLK